MNIFIIRFINKCLQVIVMFLPILLWDLFFLLQCFYNFPISVCNGINIICIFLLLFMILFGNSFISIDYTEEEVIYISFEKMNMEKAIKNVTLGSVIIITLITYASIPFYLYGTIQFIYMIFDKSHYTLSERIYDKIYHLLRKTKKEKGNISCVR